ncbi:hypothetical protein ACH42_07855 [Endozoicomonas sp. (ex Bugula neritina AB1)]|nr:hypothetical protein ACH42_07855 [Endozoicomonas sp. (ex Bugula neritina AB1)]
MRVPKLAIWSRHSVFWRIFLWFWLTMLAMLSTLLVVFAITVDPSDYLSERRALFRELEIAARKMESLSRLSVHLPIPLFPGSGYYLFDTKGNVLGSASISKDLISAYEKTRERSDPTITFRRGVLVVGPKRLTLNGGTYELYLTKEMQSLVHWRLKQVISRQWPMVIVALGVSFALCMILARYLVVPIRRLQKASRKLADGDLSARSGMSIDRRDELGELARDFDYMAEQLGSLLHSKERLLRDVSHELRSPLTRLTISLALARRKTPEAISEHDRIEREVQRLDQLIGQIIHFSRIQNGTDKASVVEVSLDSLIEQLVEDGDFEAQARNKAVVSKSMEGVTLTAMPELLGSAVENIIRNAIRFTPEGSEVEVWLLKESKTHVIVKIRDYGPGVPESALEELFEPFFRVDDTRGKENDGTGLGMAIASAAVKQHGGTISARNADPGLQVTIRIPLKNALHA